MLFKKNKSNILTDIIDNVCAVYNNNEFMEQTFLPVPIQVKVQKHDNYQDENTENKDDVNDEDDNGIIHSDIPANEWQREVEKMSIKLKTDYKTVNIIGEWRGHIEQIKTFDTVIYSLLN